MAIKKFKTVKNYAGIFKILAIFGKIFGNKPIFGTDTDTKNVPEYSTFDYRLSR